ncbi:MAG: efflux RND transporter periplasmic adaptor subunit [Arenicella sp.]
MSVEETKQTKAIQRSAKPSVEKWTRQQMPRIDAANVSQHLYSIVQTNDSKESFLMTFLQNVVSLTHAVGGLYFNVSHQNELSVGPQLLSKELMAAAPDIVGKIFEKSQTVAKSGLNENIEIGTHICCLVPIKQKTTSLSDVLVAIYDAKQKNIDQNQRLVQLLSSYVHLWSSFQENKQLNIESYFSSALLELVNKLQTIGSAEEFDSTLANQIQQMLECDKVAFGRFNAKGNTCSLKAISTVSELDKRSNLTSLLELCFFEAGKYEKTVHYSQHMENSNKESSSIFVAHQRLLDKVDGQYISTITLKKTDGDNQQLLGAISCWWTKLPKNIQPQLLFLEAACDPISVCIDAYQSKTQTLFAMNKKSVWFKYRAYISTLFIAMMLVLGFLPVEHKVKANLTLEPVVQRIISTKYDGVLKEIVVKPGEQVTQGQILARLDDQEALLKLETLQAEYESAVKNRNVKVVASNISEIQIANIETQRIALKIKLLRDQLSDLAITSPISGIVINGDIDRKQGSLVKKGEALFEVAPLNKMIAELAVPAEDITHVTAGMPLSISLDALPKKQWDARLNTIQPRATVMDNKNVFLAKVSLENDQQLQFKPGMQGLASISAGKKTVGWVLLHKAFERISRWFSMTFSSPN